MSAMSDDTVYSALNRIGKGCLYAVAALAVACYACTQTYAWERFNGSTIGRGLHDDTVHGDTSFTWHQGWAYVHRRSSWAGPDAFGIELRDPMQSGFIGMNIKERPTAGRFSVVNSQTGEPSGAYEADLVLTKRAGHNSYHADSGVVTLRREGSRLLGDYVLHFTEFTLDTARTKKHVVASGHFELK